MPEDRPIWFLDTRVTIHSRQGGNPGAVSVLEFANPHGGAPPMHVHHTEDEVFHILEGSMRFRIGEREVRATAGDTVVGPRGVPHAFVTDSPGGARTLVISAVGDFERLVLGFGRPAEGPGLPPWDGPPTPEQQAALGEACRRHNIELLGPPLPL